MQPKTLPATSLQWFVCKNVAPLSSVGLTFCHPEQSEDLGFFVRGRKPRFLVDSLLGMTEMICGLTAVLARLRC